LYGNHHQHPPKTAEVAALLLISAPEPQAAPLLAVLTPNPPVLKDLRAKIIIGATTKLLN
jgi:hypothetical protein